MILIVKRNISDFANINSVQFLYKLFLNCYLTYIFYLNYGKQKQLKFI